MICPLRLCWLAVLTFCLRLGRVLGRDFKHAVIDDYDVVILPYQNGDLSMVLAVPRLADADQLSETTILDSLAESSTK